MFEIAHSLHRQFGGDPWCIYRGKHLVNFADNHDVSRLASILTEKRHLAPAYGVLFCMPGIPCLYYGSEWGQLGEKGAGYLADVDLRPAFSAPAVEALDAPAVGWDAGTGPNELTALINRLNHVRRGSRALCHGDYRNVVITNKQLLFERAVAADGACRPSACSWRSTRMTRRSRSTTAACEASSRCSSPARRAEPPPPKAARSISTVHWRSHRSP